MPDQYFSQQLLGVSGQSGVTATAGGGQGAAFQITAEITRITVVATAGDSVKLPASIAGLDLMLINRGANSMQVFAASGSGDTIDGIAGTTGVSQMPNSCVLYFCAVPGQWESEGLATGFDKNTGLQTVSYQDGISAAGNSQGTATAINKMINNVSTVGASTGVILPASSAGMVVAVNNNQGTNALLIYPAGSEKINALAASAGFSAAANTITILYCFTAGQWFTK